MDSAKLVQLCIGVIDTFNPLRVTPETHLDLFAVGQRLEEDAKGFVGEVFYADERYAKMIKVVLGGFFERHAASVSRDDYTLYKIFLILAMRKLEEMTVPKFRRFVLAQEHHKMLTLLNFLWEPKEMDGWLEDQLCLIYDITFVQTNIVGTMKKLGPEVNALIEELQTSVQPASLNMESDQEKVKQFTKPEPFTLSESAPKKPKALSPIYKTDYKANTLPENLRTYSLKDVQRVKDERRVEVIAQTKAKYELLKPFDLETLKRPPKKSRPVVEERTTMPKAMPAPSFPEPAQAKRTAAQIMRDEQVYRKIAEEEATRLKALEENLRDESEFVEWKAKMTAEDDQRERELVESRKEDAVATAQRALDARALEVTKNQAMVKEEREKTALLMEKRAHAMEKETERKRLLKEEVIAMEANVQVARTRVEEENREVAREQIEEREKRAKKVERDREEELLAKKQLIKEIQAMEKLAGQRGKRPREFDPSTSSGLGLLDEMSLSELHERLNVLAVRDKEERDRKCGKINDERAYKSDVLAMMVRQHDRLRGEVRGVRDEERKEKKREEAFAHARKQGELHTAEVEWRAKDEGKKQAKRAKALQLAKELKAKFAKENFEMSSKGGRANAAEDGIKARADNVKADMERAFARTEKERLRQEKLEEERSERMEAKVIKQREKVKSADKREKRKSKSYEDDRLNRMRMDNSTIQEAEATLRTQQAQDFREERQSGILLRKQSNPYALEQENTHRSQRISRMGSKRSGSKNSSRGGTRVGTEFQLPGLELARQLRGFSDEPDRSSRDIGRRSGPGFDETQVRMQQSAMS
jgi:hypothetical protein